MKRTTGEWVAGHYTNESSIYCPSQKVGIAKMRYRDFQYSEEQVMLNAEYICKAVNSHEELVKALKDILTDWDEKMGVPKGYPIEEKKEFNIDGKPFYYWSPSSSMVNSVFINAARIALQKVNANT